MLCLQTLIIEVTERCQLKCAHCLRGCSRNIDIQKKTVDKLLDQCSDYIESLIFTGGEPTLNFPMMEYVFDQIRQRNIRLGNFWLATNGVENSLELAILLLKNMDLVDDPEMCGVAISNDEFHAQDTKNNPLRHLAFYDKSKEIKERTPNNTIKMGYAEENGIGRNYNPTTELSIEVDGDDIFIEELYLRANGDILADCDISYDLMDKLAICKVEELTDYVKALAAQDAEETAEEMALA